jgi:hypothetical protein
VKLSRKFKLTAAEVAELVKVGLDTPTKIKAATAEQLPAGLRTTLARWTKKLEA